MDADESNDYDKLKEAISLCYNIDQESYWQRFRATKRKDRETNRELTTRQQDLVEKWTKKCTSIAEVKDLMVLEQLVRTLLRDIGIFVVVRQPKTAMEAAKLANDYHLARKGRDGDIKHNGKAPMKPGIKCLKCGKIGHIARECRGTSLRPEIKTNGKGKRNERT